MKKRLHTDEIVNELAGSVFFPSRAKVQSPGASERSTQSATSPESAERKTDAPSPFFPTHTRELLKKTNKEKQESMQASNSASKLASTLASETDVMLVHKVLKQVGKEVLYVRLTQEEKNQVNDIEYTYQRQGIKTTGNEIGRIAINVLLADYKANGEQSILAKILSEIHT